MAKGRGAAEHEAVKVVVHNRKAHFDYEILEKYEAGIVLTGQEIKSIRETGISLAESYVRPESSALYLIGAHIKPYSFSGDKEYNPTRTRKLLLHQREVDTLRGRVEKAGLTIIPLRCYLKHGRAKIEIALAKGKQAPDKRHDIRERESRRQLERVLKRR